MDRENTRVHVTKTLVGASFACLARVHADRSAPRSLQKPAALHQEAVADTNSPTVDLNQ